MVKSILKTLCKQCQKYQLKEQRLKPLIKKYSYNQLIEECKRKNWQMPTADEVKQTPSIDKDVWVSDPVTNPDDVETHAFIVSAKTGNLLLINKNWLQAVGVFK